MAEKFESLTLEYSYLLSQQLESQRDYFEKKLMFAEEDAMDRIVSVETEVCSPSALIIVSVKQRCILHQHSLLRCPVKVFTLLK